VAMSHSINSGWVGEKFNDCVVKHRKAIPDSDFVYWRAETQDDQAAAVLDVVCNIVPSMGFSSTVDCHVMSPMKRGANGVIEVFEQNVYNVRLVKRNTLYFQNGNGIRISGQFIIYRPQPRG
jgi:hypothetical protein